MPKKAEELKPVQLRGLKPGRRAVGGVPGLLLQVATKDARDKPNSGRSSWVLQLMIGGKRRQLGLGPYPEVGLADAREKARQVRQGIRDGRDPLAEKVAAKSAIQAAAARAVTFEVAAADYIAAHQAEWKNAKHGAQWLATLETYAFPVLGKTLVADIDKAAVLKVLKPIWETKTETATRVRGRVEAVLGYAISEGAREGPNPARWRDHLEHSLAAPSKVAQSENHPALPVDLMHAFVERLKTVEGQGARALHFCILTAVRSGNVRAALWSEIDLEKAVWTIPKSKMKGQKGQEREHRVPLSPAALELLHQQRKGEPDAPVFPGSKGTLSDATLAAVIKRLNEADKKRWIDPKTGREAVPHGFRSTFSDWCSERTATSAEVREMALAHTIKDKAEAAYRRGDLLDKRRPLMELWAQFIATPPAVGNVVPIGAKKTA